MTNVVNLDNLRDMTGGDRALEKELFDVYLNASEECLAALRISLDPGQEEVWRTQAHAWKGMSLNLGAESLGQLCAEAQMNHIAAREQKEKMLTAMEEAFEKVKDFLKNA